MILNCVIIDDEPLAVGLLKSYVEQTPTLNLIGAFTNAFDAVKKVKNEHVDLVFLDIQMPEMSGLEFVKILPDDCRVVFTTAFKEYAIDGFKANAIDYLLKPISYEDFLKSYNKVRNSFNNAQHNDPIIRDECIVVKSDNKLVRISFNEILFIESVKDYVDIHLTKQRTIHTPTNLKRLEERLPHDSFMRTHRSYIANMRNFDSYEHMNLIFGNNTVPISESFKDRVMKFLEEHYI